MIHAVRTATASDVGAALYLDDGDGCLQLVASEGQGADVGTSPVVRSRVGLLRRGHRHPDGGASLMMRLGDGTGGLLVLRRSSDEEFSFGDRAIARLYARQLTDHASSGSFQPRSTLWTRQLEAIQRVSAQFTRLVSLEEVALAICVETRQVVDYDNARVYVLGGDGTTLEPVAFHSDTEEYAGETVDALRVSVGEGITGWVAQHGEPLVVTDASRDPRSLQIPGTLDVAEESMLLVPLRDDGAVTGVIVLSKLGIARFDQDDLRLLQILSDQAAIAIENARLLAARDRLVAELNCMLDISLTYAQADEELALAGLLSMKLARAGRADACIISRWEESAASLRTLGAHGVAVPDPTYDVLGSPVTRNVLRDARPEVLQAGGGHDPGDARLMGTLDARTLLLLPLIAAGRTIGLVELFWVAAAKSFTADELDVYRTMANQAGAVLENVRLLEQLRQAADIDQLTGVHNHRYLQERLGQEVARSTRSRSRLSVLMVDLDGFKRINDEHGHGVGDHVLRSVAARLKLAVRETDIVARYGGDEFVVLMPDTSEEQARHVAKRLVAGIRGRAFELGEGACSQLGASVGLAVFPEDGRSPQALLAAADGAMYGVKRGGGSDVRRAVRSGAR